MKKQPVPLFVLGSGRSGTTITATLLNRLDRVHIAKETGYIGQCLPLLRKIHEDGCLQQLVENVNSWLATEQWEQRATVDGYRRFCDQHEVSGAAAFIHYIWQLESSTPWNELEYIGDNTPLYVMSIPGILELLPDVRFIHIVRDPRDVVCSVVKMRFGAEDPIAAALEWHTTIGCWLMSERMIEPSHRTECRYEDLCGSPADALGKLAAFLGRSPDEATAAVQAHLQDATRDLAAHTKVASLSHHCRLSEPLSAHRVGRFRNELTAEQIERIEEIVQYGMLAYGYQLAEWRTSPLMKGDRFAMLRILLRDIALKCSKRLRLR